MNRPLKRFASAISAETHGKLATFGGYSERTILLGTILLATIVSAVIGFVLSQYYSVDVISSLTYYPNDCAYVDMLDSNTPRWGWHCFSDYGWPAKEMGMRSNPWEPYQLPRDVVHLANDYTAGAMLPQTTFGLIGKALGAPAVGLFGYVLTLTLAVFSPAVWAARGVRGLDRLVVFVALGAAAVPAWIMIDRGNAAGFVVPLMLVYLVALSRHRWGLVTIVVILAALIKPQFAMLAIALFAARKWRWGGKAIIGIAISNFAAYLLWPRDFPKTIAQSLSTVLSHGMFRDRVGEDNVSFGKGLLMIPDALKALETGGRIPDGFLAGPRAMIGYVVAAAVAAGVVALGRRIPPVMAGIVLLATASLFPAMTARYYLVFAIAVAAIITRDPDGPAGSGIFDRFQRSGERRRALGVCLSVVTALSIAHIPLATPRVQVPYPVNSPIVIETGLLAPVLWFVACAAIMVSYARQPSPSDGDDEDLNDEDLNGATPLSTVGNESPRAAELLTES